MKDKVIFVICVILFGIILYKSCSTPAIEASAGCLSHRVLMYPTAKELKDPNISRACAQRAWLESRHSAWLMWATASAKSANKGETPAEWWIRQR